MGVSLLKKIICSLFTSVDRILSCNRLHLGSSTVKLAFFAGGLKRFFFAALRRFVTLRVGGNSTVILRIESGHLVTDLLACGVWASASVCSGSVGAGDAGDEGIWQSWDSERGGMA